jgi:hypothetical protein
MIMEPASQDFSKLQRLLALKRHEQPPPGHLDSLAANVRANIRAQRDEAPEPWWRALLPNFQTRPAYSFAFSGLAVGAVGVAILLTQNNPAGNSIASDKTPASNAAAIVDAATNFPSVPVLQTPVDTASFSNSTAPPGLFSPTGQIERVRFGPKR